MLTDPLISVIMPAYNVAQYISASILSVQAQSYREWELIIIDDGSTDSTAEVAYSYQNDARIRYIYQDNAGQAVARNVGVAAAKGQYIAFLDADDLWLPEKLSLSIGILEEHMDTDLVFTNSFIMDGESKPVHSLNDLGVATATYVGPKGVIFFLEGNRAPTLTVVVRRSVLILAGGFRDRKLAEDYELWIRLLIGGATFRASSTCSAIYRIREDSLTALDRNVDVGALKVLCYLGKERTRFRPHIYKILRVRFKQWLNAEAIRSRTDYRVIIGGIRPRVTSFTLYLASYFTPFKYLRKLTNRLL